MDKFFTGLGISLIIFGSFLVYQRNSPRRIAFASAENSVVAKGAQILKPSQIEIARLGIKLPVVESQIVNNNWEVSDVGVSYLASSPVPGEVGNSILYGHNWTNLLGRLINIKTGDDIDISYLSGEKKVFKVVLIQEVSPNDVSILKNTKDSRVTLYTCSGFLDSKRFVVVAVLKS